MSQLLGHEMDLAEILDMISEADMDDDGKIRKGWNDKRLNTIVIVRNCGKYWERTHLDELKKGVKKADIILQGVLNVLTLLGRLYTLGRVRGRLHVSESANESPYDSMHDLYAN
jgi:hypothetical protein